VVPHLKHTFIFYTNAHSKVDRGGDEEPTQAYDQYVEERDEETTKVYE